MTRTFARSIPNQEAISVLSALSRSYVAFEVGSGYWASLLQKAGMVVDAYDLAPPVDTWTKVTVGGWSTVLVDDACSERALLLCSPHQHPAGFGLSEVDSSVAGAVNAYTGSVIVHVGAGVAPCAAAGGDEGGEGVADDVSVTDTSIMSPPLSWKGLTPEDAELKQALPAAGYTLTRRVVLPRWINTYDELTIWTRA
jgi:hypothetical protein